MVCISRLYFLLIALQCIEVNPCGVSCWVEETAMQPRISSVGSVFALYVMWYSVSGMGVSHALAQSIQPSTNGSNHISNRDGKSTASVPPWTPPMMLIQPSADNLLTPPMLMPLSHNEMDNSLTSTHSVYSQSIKSK
jgi:hypothetical protein